MKLEKGMYARVQELNEIIIVKISKVEDDGFNADNNMFYMFSEVIKASYNIIDLIEVGDIVNGKPVAELYEDERCVTLDDNDKGWRTIVMEKEIKTILTKEQFENNCYRICD